ncbi:hypothetical protein [Rhodococcus koreensis]
MAVFPVVKGTRLRATRVDACGMPIAGPRSRVVTEGWISLQLSPQMRDADEIEQTNAEGRVCVSDRTPPERKWWNATLELCKVDPCLFSMFTDWELVTDYAGESVGFSDQKRVPADRGVAIEVWTGVGSDDTCEVPTTDDILSASGSTLPYGYFVIPVIKEATLGDIEIGASAATFTLTGITASGARWGRGPYNVQATDVDNTAGRLLTPFKATQHIRVLRTTVPPPAVEEGCCPLILPSPYYGATAIDEAPAQPACDAVGTNEEQRIDLGAATSGAITLSFKGSAPSASIAHNAAATAVQTALEALSTIGEGNVTVTGAEPWDVEFVGALGESKQPLLDGVATGLTGGTLTITETVEGGQF